MVHDVHKMYQIASHHSNLNNEQQSQRRCFPSDICETVRLRECKTAKLRVLGCKTVRV